jgi:hypothetical protein
MVLISTDRQKGMANHPPFQAQPLPFYSTSLKHAHKQSENHTGQPMLRELVNTLLLFLLRKGQKIAGAQKGSGLKPWDLNPTGFLGELVMTEPLAIY